MAETSKLFRVDGKVALVTGGSRGLGYYSAEALLKGGARTVILVSRKAEGANGLNQAVTKLSQLTGIIGTATSITADISKISEIERVISEIQKTETKIDIVIANAGATWGGPFESSPDSSSQKVLDLNVRSVFNLIRLTVPLLSSAATTDDPSRVIIMGSVAGIGVPHVGEHGTIMYAASKAAAHHIARSLAVELGPRHITTNAIAPGFFPSRLANGLIELLGGEKEMNAKNPRGRLGRPEDIAGAILYLCAPSGSYVNGLVLPLDGGEHLTAGTKTKL